MFSSTEQQRVEPSFEKPACQDMSLGTEIAFSKVFGISSFRIMARKELGCEKKTSYVVRSYSDTVINPFLE
jgi:hypothetical protein